MFVLFNDSYQVGSLWLQVCLLTKNKTKKLELFVDDELFLCPRVDTEQRGESLVRGDHSHI